MEEVKRLIAENDKEGLKLLLADKTPKFCCEALFRVIQKADREIARSKDLDSRKIAYGNNKELLQIFLDHGADVNAIITEEPILQGLTIFELACLVASADIVKLLLDFGADLTRKDVRGLLPIHIAALHGNLETIKLLVNSGTDVNETSVDGATALELVVEGGKVDVAKYLLEHGADVHLGWEYLLHAAISEFGNKETVELLLDHGAKVNEANPLSLLGDKLPLHSAAEGGNEEIVKLLLDRGADINAVYDEKTAMEISIEEGHVESAKVLVTQMVLMKTRGLHVSDQNWSNVGSSDALVEQKNKCENELESMKSEELDDSSVTCYDIFECEDDGKLACWARNGNILRALKSTEFLKKFPYYGQLVIENFKRGISRNKDFELIKRFFKYLSTRDHDILPQLPATFVDNLSKYLNVKDVDKLRNL